MIVPPTTRPKTNPAKQGTALVSQAMASGTTCAQPKRFLASPLSPAMPWGIILCRFQLISHWGLLTLNARHLCWLCLPTSGPSHGCCRAPYLPEVLPCISMQPATDGSQPSDASPGNPWADSSERHSIYSSQDLRVRALQLPTVGTDSIRPLYNTFSSWLFNSFSSLPKKRPFQRPLSQNWPTRGTQTKTCLQHPLVFVSCHLQALLLF